MIQSSIVKNKESLLLKIGGEILPPYAYTSYNPQEKYYEDFKNIGFKLFSICIYAGDKGINPASGLKPFAGNFWIGENKYDFSIIEKHLKLVIKKHKPGEIYIITRINLNPPKWWEEKYPDELALTYNKVPLGQSFCSKKWLSDCRKIFTAYKKWLFETGYDNYVIGWHIAGGSTEEFVSPRLSETQFIDYSQCAVREFILWSKQKYNDNLNTLNCAWRTDYSSFDEIMLPEPFDRALTEKGNYRDYKTEKKVIDYYEFHSDTIANAIIELSKQAKEVLEYKQIVGAFYGYVSVLDAEQGHSSIQKVLKADTIDFLASPFVYVNLRGKGVDWFFFSSVESAHMNSKLWFLEADIRTNLSKSLKESLSESYPDGNDLYSSDIWYGPETAENSQWHIIKAFSRIITHNTACWWFDMWGGWYDSLEFMNLHKKLKEIYFSQMLEGNNISVSQTAVFVDEKLVCGTVADNTFAYKCVYQQFLQLGFSGIAYDFFLMSSFSEISPDKYKMALFLSPLNWSENDIRTLNKWKNNNRTIIFTGIPGIYNDKIQSVTEIKCDIGNEILNQMPQIIITDSDIKTLDAEEASNPVIYKNFGSYKVLWQIIPEMKAEKLRKYADYSGVHIYNYTNDIIYTNNQYIAITATAKGSKRISLPFKAYIEDVVSEKKYYGNSIYFDFFMEFDETRLFKIYKTSL